MESCLLLICPNTEYGIEFYSYSLFDRVDSIPYLTRIRNKEWSNVCVLHSVFYKIDVTIKVAQAANVSAGTAAVFTRIIYN